MGPTTKRDLSKVQPSKTGVTQDFINEFAGVIQFIELYQNKKISFEQFSKEIFLLKTYQERYPKDRYDNVITLQNSQLVKELDNLVHQINSILREMKKDTYHKIPQKIEEEMNELNRLGQLGVRLIRG